MRRLLAKLLIKLIGENPLALGKVDTEKMQDWLFVSFSDKGYKQYYTFRKKCIQNELTIGADGKEYWKKIGRIEELRALNDNIIKESNRRKNISNQHKE